MGNWRRWCYIFFICFSQSGFNQSNGVEIGIINAEQEYKISKSYECGHPVQYKVFSCHCGCNDLKINKEFSEKYGFNENECNEKKLLCFTISAKLNTTTKKCPAGLQALCALRFSSKYIYTILILESPSQFYGLLISRHGDEDEEISLPTIYPTLIIGTTAIRVKHVYPYKKLFVDRTGLHFVREGTRKIYIARGIFNSYKGKINLKSFCWNQLTNHDAVMNETRRFELMTDGVCSNTCDQQVCDGNTNGLNITKIQQIKGLDSEDSELPGIEINLLHVDVLNTTVSFFYNHDKDLYMELVPDFTPLVETVCRNNEKIYAKLYPNSTNTQNPVSIAIYDKNKSMISQKETMLLNEIVTLQFQENFFYYSGSKVLVCIFMNLNSFENRCEYLDLKNTSEPVCEEFIDYGITSSIPSLVIEVFSRTNTEQENATFVNIDSSNLSNNTAINSTHDIPTWAIIISSVFAIILISSVFAIVVCIVLRKRKDTIDSAVSHEAIPLSVDSVDDHDNRPAQEGNVNSTNCCTNCFNNYNSGQSSGNKLSTGYM